MFFIVLSMEKNATVAFEEYHIFGELAAGSLLLSLEALSAPNLFEPQLEKGVFAFSNVWSLSGFVL